MAREVRVRDAERRRRRLRIEWVATGLFAAALLVALLVTGATSRLDNAIYDLTLKFVHRTPRPDIVIVAVDSPSLTQEGEWPWPRRRLANLIGDIAEGRPKALGWYFLFASRSTPADDAAVRDALKQTRAYLGDPGGERSGPHPTFRPDPMFASAAAGTGVVDSEGDGDGIVRRALLFVGESDDLKPRLALQMASLAGKGPSVPRHPHLVDRSTGKFGAGEILIPFAGGPGTIRHISASDVLEHKISPRVFHDKFVLVGATAGGLLDNYPTPVSSVDGMPNVEVDANILDALLQGVAIRRTSNGVTLAVSLLLIGVLLFAMIRLHPRDYLWLALVMILAPLAGAIGALCAFHVWAPPVSYLATLGLVLPYWGWRRLDAASAYFAEELSSLEETLGRPVIDDSRATVGFGGDVVLQQIALLEEAKRRIADLRRFVSDILSNFPDPVLVADRAGRVVTFNEAAAVFAGRLGIAADAGILVPDLLAAFSALDGDAKTSWPPAQTAEPASPPITIAGSGGRLYELRYTATRSAGDELTGWIVHLADVTSLVSAMRQREEALQLLSHDMRSPLASIVATLNHPDFHAVAPPLRKRIEAHALRTLQMADAFVRLAKAESAQYHLEAIDLAHVVQDAAEIIWPLAQAAQVKIDVETPDVEHVVLADRGLLTRALVNLLDNAVKFSAPGQTVSARLWRDELAGCPAVACEIADHAGGIPQARLADLFRKFASSKDALSGSAGVGLGLALVRTVVTRLDGVVACRSVEGEGTAFTITLPLHQDVLDNVSDLIEA